MYTDLDPQYIYIADLGAGADGGEVDEERLGEDGAAGQLEQRQEIRAG